jgi:hypothetical protein
MLFNAASILKTFKSMEVANAPQLKHTQYLNYCAQLLGYTDYNHFKGCLDSAPSDRLGDYHTSLMKKICALRVPKEGVEHVRLSDYNGRSISFDSYFIGWDKHGNEVRVPETGHCSPAITDFRTFFDRPLYVIETEAELLAWQWNWGSFAAVPVAMAKSHFPSLFNKKHLVVENPPLELIKRKIRRKQKRSGLI